MQNTSDIDFIEVKVICPEDFRDILIAELAEGDFDNFMETDEGFNAYTEGNRYEEALVAEVMERYGQLDGLRYEVKPVEMINWNEEWEKNYEPIIVENRCLVKASFHNVPGDFEYVITVNPKMAFGTGHHHTTYLMLQEQMELDHAGKSVADIGCGTGILAIMAKLRGAAYTEAFDVSDWSVQNTEENLALNNCRDVQVRLGTVADLEFTNTFDILLANINRNVLMEEIPTYRTLMREKGILLVSGFFEYDAPHVIRSAKKAGLKETARNEREQWTVIRFEIPK